MYWLILSRYLQDIALSAGKACKQIKPISI